MVKLVEMRCKGVNMITANIKNKIDKELEQHGTLIMLTRFGSHLYGTDTPKSDVDYKGIYIPYQKNILLGRFKDSINLNSNNSSSKNTNDDVDCEIYSIHKFMKLAYKSETVAIDMIHANRENILYTTAAWEYIQSRRKEFYTSEMNAFVGYARKQAAKYGLRGSRLDAADDLLEVLKQVHPETRMIDIWSELPTNEYCHYAPFVQPSEHSIYHYNFCGKIIQSTSKVKYNIDMVEKFIDQYGHRAKLAQKNEGVDWKAISHALRAAYQLIEIYDTGDLKFPLSNAHYLKMVKAGELEFTDVLETLEALMVMVEELSGKSNVPKKLEQEKVDNFLLNALAIGMERITYFY